MKEIEIRSRFLGQVKEIIVQAQNNAVRAVNTARVTMYWNIGKTILEEEQQGKERADYGSFLIKKLALELEPQFGTGFSARQLERCRQFYREFPIASALRSQFSWTHYK